MQKSDGNLEFVFRIATDDPSELEILLNETAPSANISKLDSMIGLESIFLVAIPLIGLAGSAASIISLYRDFVRSNKDANKITHVYVKDENREISISSGAVSEEVILKILKEFSYDHKE